MEMGGMSSVESMVEEKPVMISKKKKKNTWINSNPYTINKRYAEEEEMNSKKKNKWMNSNPYSINKRDAEAEEELMKIKNRDKEYAAMYHAAANEFFEYYYKKMAVEYVVPRIIANTPRKPHRKFLIMVSLKLFGLFLCYLLASMVALGSLKLIMPMPKPSHSSSPPSPPTPTLTPPSLVVELANLKNEFHQKVHYLESQFQQRFLSLEAELEQIKSKDVAYERSSSYPECKIKGRRC